MAKVENKKHLSDTHVRANKLLERAKESGNKDEIAKWEDRVEACEKAAA